MISISAFSRFSIRFVFYVRSFDIVLATPPPCFWFPMCGSLVLVVVCNTAYVAVIFIYCCLQAIYFACYSIYIGVYYF